MNIKLKLVVTYLLSGLIFSGHAQSYCTPSFSGDCDNVGGDHQYVTRVNIFTPAGSLAANDFSGARLGHCPTASSCNVGVSDYQFHDYDNTATICPGFGQFGIGPNGYHTDPASQCISPGGNFDFFFYGNSIEDVSLPEAMALSVFIDWNMDGDFNELNELVISTPVKTWDFPNPAFAPDSAQNVYPIQVPLTANEGTARMRVIICPIPYNDEPCLNFASGSARDYEFKTLCDIPCSDMDMDEVCDSVDVCDNWDDNLLGTACNDGFSNTVDDEYIDCETCVGTDEGCPSDINQDGSVDVNDFLSFVSAFGSTCLSCAEDINDDGLVDVADFIVFNSQFGWVCGP